MPSRLGSPLASPRSPLGSRLRRSSSAGGLSRSLPAAAVAAASPRSRTPRRAALAALLAQDLVVPPQVAK
jgi:hypothetical protein